MIEHELLFLGLLVEGPKHGYEIKRQIEEDLAPNISLKIKSIYYPLRKLDELGLIQQEKGREGRWPEKFVYRLTPKGKKRFDTLIAESFLSVERPYFDLDLSIYFLPVIDKVSAKRRLRAHQTLLKKIQRQLIALQALQQHKPQRLIINHNLLMVEAELASAQQLIEAL